LRQWKAPLVNDFFAMIAFGVLGRLVEKWLAGSPPTLVNDLLCAEGGIISTEPARGVRSLALLASPTPGLARLLTEEEPSALAGQEFGAFQHALAAYLARFGDRCANELKLETVTLAEDPSPLFSLLRQHLTHGIPPEDALPGKAARAEAEVRIGERLRGVRRG